MLNPTQNLARTIGVQIAINLARIIAAIDNAPRPPLGLGGRANGRTIRLGG